MARPHNCPPITVLICTLNEAQNLPYILPKIPDWVDEILLVDGHSTDCTAELAKEICPQVNVVCQPGRGKGDALKFGIEQATGDIIITLDADGSTDPVEIPNFINPLLKGYDFVKGSRFLKRRPRMPLYRQFGNLILSTTANILFGTKYTDVCSGYNAFWKKAFQTMHLSNNGFEMEQEMVVKVKKLGLKAIEVEQYDAGRLSSYSKVSGIKQGFIDLWVIIKERF
jgi:glycosyltransferase involved in cell wall biosynthesis